jgi:4-hydroxy-2-oxoheptanedioate aldolase
MNALSQLLASGKPAINGWLNIASGFTAELMALAGFDSVVIDLQHGLHDYNSMVNCLQAIQGLPVTPMVRVAWNEPIMIGRALDAGAQGVICPMISSRGEAEALVRHCKYPPLGGRSNGPIRAGLYGEGPYQGRANAETLCIPLIETRGGMENLPAILDVEGVAGVYVGPSDLRLSYGLPLRVERTDPDFAPILRLYEMMVRECERRGRFACMHTGSIEEARYYLGMGFRLVTISSDSDGLAAAARNIVAQFRAAIA